MTAPRDPYGGVPHPADVGDVIPLPTRARGSWSPVDLEPVLDGTHQPVQPTIGARTDGVGLIYPGRLHSVAGESESLKTWLMLCVARTELERGNAVVYIDFEDDEGGIGGRMLALETPPASLRDRFAYLRPEEPVNALGNGGDLTQVLADLAPTLVVLDGVTEAMTLHGLNPLDNRDAAAFGRLLPRRLAATGAAVVSLDHVTKSTESRGRYAIGAAHKLNGLNGAAYTLENRTPFGVGLTGRSTVSIVKDRPGQLRRHALPSNAGHWFADLTLTSEPGFIDATLHPPIPRDETFRPTHNMHRVAQLLAAAPEPLSVRGVLDRSTGIRDVNVRAALAALVDDGYVTTAPGPRGATLHTLTKPYGDDPGDPHE